MSRLTVSPRLLRAQSARPHPVRRSYGLSFMRNTPATFLIIVLVAVTALAVSARTWFIKTGGTGKLLRSGAQEQVASQGPTTTPVPLQTERVTITPHGFEPAVITRPKGKFYLAVANRSGLNAVTFRIDRVVGNRLKEVALPREKVGWKEIVDLTPGDYVLTEATHLSWGCHIIITPQ